MLKLIDLQTYGFLKRFIDLKFLMLVENSETMNTTNIFGIVILFLGKR